MLTERGFHASLDYIRETTPAYRTLTLTLTLILTLTLTLTLTLPLGVAAVAAGRA